MARTCRMGHGRRTEQTTPDRRRPRTVRDVSSKAPLEERPLRIGLVVAQRVWDGGERQAGLLAEGLIQRGHLCTLFTPQGSAAAERMHGKLPIVCYPGRGRAPWTLRRLRRILRACRLDVLHMNDPHAVTSVGIAGWGLPIPLRVVARRVDFAVNSPRLYRALGGAVVCVSQSVAQACIDSGLPADRLHTIHDGVDPERMARGDGRRVRAELGVADDAPLLVGIGRLVYPKGFQTLIGALQAVRRRYPRVRLLIAGDGDYAAELKQLIRQHRLCDCVHLLGYRRDVADLMAAATLFVMPSYREGLCSSVIDAMFARRAVVASDTGGMPELLAETESQPLCGWLVPPRAEAELAGAICEALSDRHERQKRAEAAWRRATERFTADAMVARTVRLYRRLLKASCVHAAPARVHLVRT